MQESLLKQDEVRLASPFRISINQHFPQASSGYILLFSASNAMGNAVCLDRFAPCGPREGHKFLAPMPRCRLGIPWWSHTLGRCGMAPTWLVTGMMMIVVRITHDYPWLPTLVSHWNVLYHISWSPACHSIACAGEQDKLKVQNRTATSGRSNGTSGLRNANEAFYVFDHRGQNKLWAGWHTLALEWWMFDSESSVEHVIWTCENLNKNSFQFLCCILDGSAAFSMPMFRTCHWSCVGCRFQQPVQRSYKLNSGAERLPPGQQAHQWAI